MCEATDLGVTSINVVTDRVGGDKEKRALKEEVLRALTSKVTLRRRSPRMRLRKAHLGLWRGHVHPKLRALVWWEAVVEGSGF